MTDFDPLDFIDHDDEQDLFRRLVMAELPARILTICDEGGQGKSSLLQRLKYNCQYEMGDPVPVCLIELDKLHDPSAFTFTSALVSGFTAQGGNIGERFAEFNFIDQAIGLRDYSLFKKGAAFQPQDPRISGTASAQMMLGGVNAATYHNIERAGNIHFSPPEDFPDNLKTRAEQECVKAFFDDLRAICASTPMVVLLDTWERCNLALRRWIHDVMLHNHVLHRDQNLRPEKFRMVIAGRPHDPVRLTHGLRADEFRQHFRSDGEFSDSVLSLPTLSEWKNEHVSKFMLLNGCPEPDEDDVGYIQRRLRDGHTRLEIQTLIELSFRPRRTG